MLCELVEQRGIQPSIESMAPLVEQADVHVRDLVDRMSDAYASYPGNLSGLADVLGLTDEEMMRLARAFSYEQE